MMKTPEHWSHRGLTAAALSGTAPPRVVDQDAAHGTRRDGEEVATALEV